MVLQKFIQLFRNWTYIPVAMPYCDGLCGEFCILLCIYELLLFDDRQRVKTDRNNRVHL